jgi:PAS domain S-box-containing protein
MKDLRVLYIEHEPSHRKDLTGILKEKGYRVTVAASGQTGLRQLERRHFDVVLCDLDMPDVDGIRVLEKTKKLHPDLPFIMLSSRASIPQAVRAIQKGASDFVLEPPHPDELETTIKNAVEKMRLQTRLKRSEHDLQAFVENVPDILYSLGPGGTFQSISPSLKPNLGYSPAELLGRTILEIIHPEDRDQVSEMLRESIRSSKPLLRKEEFRMLTKSGEVRHFEIRGRTIVENGRFVRGDGIARDITERISFEKKLEQSRDELQAIMDCSPNGMLLVDPNNRVLTANQSIETMFDIRIDRILARSYDDFLRAIRPCFEDFEGFLRTTEQVKGLYEKSRHQEFDLSWTSRFGVKQIKPVERILIPFSVPVKGRHGEDLGLLWIYSDVSGIIRSLDQLRTIVNASPLPIVVSRIHDGKVIFVNSHLAALLGYTLEDVQEKTTEEFLYHPGDRINLVDKLREVGRFQDQEIQVTRKDGSVIWVLLSSELTRLGEEPVAVTGLYDINERRQMEEALQYNERKYRELVEYAHSIIMRWDQNGTITFFNEFAQNFFGYTEKEILGQNVMGTIVPEIDSTGRNLREMIEDLEQDPEKYISNENENIKRSGERVWISWTNRPIYDESGKLKEILSIGKDETTRNQAEKAMASRLRYEEGLAACSKILLTDTPLKEALNESLELLLEASGTSRAYIMENIEDPQDGLSMRQIHEVCAPGIACRGDSPALKNLPYSVVFESWREALSQDRPCTGITRRLEPGLRGKFAQQGVLSIVLLPIRVKDQWYGFIGFDDIEKERAWSEEDTRLLKTAADMIGSYLEKRKVEFALRESEARFRGYVENANDIIYVLTPEGIFSYVSPNWTEILGHEISEVEGQSFVPFVHPDDLPACMKFFESVIIQGKKRSNIEYRVKHKNGDWRWHRSSASPLKDKEGKTDAFIGIAHDVTEMKQVMEDLEKINRDLKETQTQLAQSEKMASLGQLVAGVAHEINTPIGAVNSMLDTLFRTLNRLKEMCQRDILKDQQQSPGYDAAFTIISDAENVIKSGTDRVIDIVTRLRSFARLDEAELKTVDIHKGLEDTLVLIHNEIKHHITLIKDYGRVPPVSCYPGQLNQVFLNLLINGKQAILAHKEKGTITIKTFPRKDHAVIQFIDDGPGIPTENLHKIFDPGFTTKGVGVGTGLGLSICYQIVKNHRGEIRAESPPGQGSTFTIEIPIDLGSILEREEKGN